MSSSPEHTAPVSSDVSTDDVHSDTQSSSDHLACPLNSSVHVSCLAEAATENNVVLSEVIEYFPYHTFRNEHVEQAERRCIRGNLLRSWYGYYGDVANLYRQPIVGVVPFLVGHLPCHHAHAAVLMLLQVAGVWCFHIEAVRNPCARIVYIAAEHAEPFQFHHRRALLGDVHGIWVAKTQQGGELLAKVKSSKGSSCPCIAVTIELSKRRKARGAS